MGNPLRIEKTEDNYIAALKADAVESKKYFAKSMVCKTQQQIRLEQILSQLSLAPKHIADIACGSGSLSYHLSVLYPNARFTLVDANEDALDIARESAQSFNADVMTGNAHALPILSDSYDLVFFWHTLLCITNPKKAFKELLRICKPGGRVFISSLFNVDNDVDLYINAVDHTRPSANKGGLPYNCFCEKTIKIWTDYPLTFHDFDMPIDLPAVTRGVGTYTRRLDDGQRLQISAGMLMNWKILEVRKPELPNV